jgi:DUF1680 family protein
MYKLHCIAPLFTLSLALTSGRQMPRPRFFHFPCCTPSIPRMPAIQARRLSRAPLYIRGSPRV